MAVVAFPELGLSGYSNDDLFHQSVLLDASEDALGTLAQCCSPAVCSPGPTADRAAFRVEHVADTMVLVDPDGFEERLAAAGFEAPEVQAAKDAFRFRARVPATVAA